MEAKRTRPRAVRRILPPLAILTLAFGCGAVNNDEPVITPQERAGLPPTGPVPPAGMAWVIFGADTVHAEVARTAAQRSQGLMNREELPAGTGMLFVFPDSEIRSFWMQNTYVALDIAFMDADLRIVDIQQMEAQSEDYHESRAPAMFALEVPMGWFAEHGITVGQRADVIFGG